MWRDIAPEFQAVWIYKTGNRKLNSNINMTDGVCIVFKQTLLVLLNLINDNYKQK